MARLELFRMQSIAQKPLRASVAQILVAHAYGVTLEEMRAATRRTSQAAFARQIAMYLAHVVFELRIAAVARAFARDRSTVCYAIQRIEALRENPDLDRTLGWLENLLRVVAERL